ncbi:hypothetical protein [Acidovorax sp.]|uniref:hypothetical protein n=1 Tax=Acidovorax sp. TaxID=1872122 RepID=UPI002FB81485
MAISHQAPALRAFMPWTLALLAGAAFAQTPGDAEASRAALPTQLQYSSAMSDYQAYKDQPVQSWRQVNDRVGAIGGWRAYAKEVQTGVPASAQDAAPAKDPHTGHHGGGKP